MSNIVYSAIRTPDGTVIESRSRHDYVTHKDANGKSYMIDGGLDYLRRSANGDEEVLTVYLEDGHDKVREVLAWGTYGKDGKQPYKLVLIKDMTRNHLQAVLDNCLGAWPQIRQAMQDELGYRKQMKIEPMNPTGD